jgi:hypothetical protein
VLIATGSRGLAVDTEYDVRNVVFLLHKWHMYCEYIKRECPSAKYSRLSMIHADDVGSITAHAAIFGIS